MTKNFERLSQDVAFAKDRLGRAKASVKIEREAYLEADGNITSHEEAQNILQRIAQSTQEQVHKQITKIVSQCLQSVFDDPYRFEISFDRKRGRTEAKIKLIRADGLILTEPTDEAGIGVIDIASFALRLACLFIQKPRGRLLMVLDEPFKHLQPAYRLERARKMLDMLADEMGVQFILATHIKKFSETGTTIEIGEDDE